MIGGESHELLKKLEGNRLERLGYAVEYEKRVLPHWIVDIFATKGEEKLVIECGFCLKFKSEIMELLKVATKFVHVTDLRKWIRWEDVIEIALARNNGLTVDDLRRLEELERRKPYDWSEQLKTPARF